MAGLNHDFFLVSCDLNNYGDFSEFYNHPKAVLLHDDLISYMGDTLKWIPCYFPKSRNKLVACEGLNYDTLTIIKQDGANIARKIFTLWADLFLNSPEDLKLTGNFGWIEGEDKNSGNYSVIKAIRDEIVKSLKQIADYAKDVESSSEKLFILHLGI